MPSVTIPTLRPAPPLPTNPPAGYLRPLQIADIEALAQLFLRVYRAKDQRPSPGLCAHFRRLFFSDPWAGLEVSPSMAYFSKTGDLSGFFGAYPRRFVCGGEPIPTVLLGQLMVHPQYRRRGIARQLTAAILAGPQKLTYTTTASVLPSNRLLRQLGFLNPTHAGLRWFKALHPAGSLRRIPGAGRIGGRLRRLRWWMSPRRSHPLGRPMNGPAELCALRATVVQGVALRPELDHDHACWVWDLLADTGRRGSWTSCVVEDSPGRAAGYVLYFVARDRHAKVLELAAAPGRIGDVVGRYFRHAADCGLLGVRGRCTTPQMTAELVNHGARLEHSLSGTVFHTNHPAVRQALINGDVFLSELDAESWLSFADA